jgi:gamma-glutamyl-gamma-aminobutyrate hydrolase PuuD
VNSVHHQGVRALGRGLRVEAVSAEDGVVEAVRYDPSGSASADTASPFAYGVQWHPEFLAAQLLAEGNGGTSAPLDPQVLLRGFLDEVRKRKK